MQNNIKGINQFNNRLLINQAIWIIIISNKMHRDFKMAQNRCNNNMVQI